jgi:hypothetical protein
LHFKNHEFSFRRYCVWVIFIRQLQTVFVCIFQKLVVHLSEAIFHHLCVLILFFEDTILLIWNLCDSRLYLLFFSSYLLSFVYHETWSNATIQWLIKCVVQFSSFSLLCSLMYIHFFVNFIWEGTDFFCYLIDFAFFSIRFFRFIFFSRKISLPFSHRLIKEIFGIVKISCKFCDW